MVSRDSTQGKKLMIFRKKKQSRALRGNYIATLIEHQVRGQGLDVDALLSPIGLSEASLHKRKFYVTTAQYQHLITELQTVTTSHELAFNLIDHIEITNHGVLGMLIMCSLTMRQAIKQLLRFHHLQSNLLSFRVTENKEVTKLTFVPNQNLAETEQFTLEIVMAIFYKTMKNLFGFPEKGTQVCFNFAKTADMKHHQDYYCKNVLYNQPETCLIFPSSRLDVKLKYANKNTFSVLEEQCNRSSAELDDNQDIVASVRQYLRDSNNTNISLENTAQHFAVSARTLSRHLNKVNSSHQYLLDEERIRRAKELFIDTKLTVTEVAMLLNFSDCSHLSKMFKRHVGQPPKKFRQQQPTATAIDR